MEIWKDVRNYETFYKVNNKGDIKNVHTGKILKYALHKTGYLQVFLYKNGKRKNHLVHRIVAEAFLDNPDNLPQVNHKNEIKTDNRVENLEFCDAKYNMNYGTRPQISSKPVYQYSIDEQFIKEYTSTMDVERQLGFAHTHISDCCLNKRKQAYSFIWKYK